MAEFVVGGSMPLGSPVYQTRPFEDECFTAISQNRWVVLLGPRQHGKSSALLRLRQRLTGEGFSVANLDFQGYASQDDNYAAFLGWFIAHVSGVLDVPTEHPRGIAVEDLESWLGPVLTDLAGSVVIIVDEATALPAPVRTRFYSQLRALYNTRALSGTAWPARLMFVFSGTFVPDQVIVGDNSPFNVSQVVHCGDLTVDQARQLARAASGTDTLVSWAEKAFLVVGGQPYLLQRLLDTVSAGSTDDDRAHLLEAAVADIIVGKDPHVPALIKRLASVPGALEAAGRMIESADGIAATYSEALALLPIVGVARMEGGRLFVRNELYRRVLTASPQATETGGGDPQIVPLAEQPRERFANAVMDGALEELAFESFQAAVAAANSGHNRLALVGLGSCYETLLLDYLTHRVTSPDLTAAKSKLAIAPAGLNPSGWKLEAMIDVAEETGGLPGVNAGVSHALRDWRNSVHPSKALSAFQPQPDLAPEVKIAVASVEKLLQALEKLPI